MTDGYGKITYVGYLNTRHYTGRNRMNGMLFYCSDTILGVFLCCLSVCEVLLPMSK